MLHGLLNFDVASAAWDGSNLNRTAEQLTMDIVKRDLETTNESNITTGCGLLERQLLWNRAVRIIPQRTAQDGRSHSNAEFIRRITLRLLECVAGLRANDIDAVGATIIHDHEHGAVNHVVAKFAVA